jgi:hypothetical protein
MSVKIVFAAALALTLGACSSLSPVLTSGATTTPPLRIHGDLVDLTDVKIFINGDKVIDQQVSLLRGDGEFSGTYAGKPVTASCSTEPQRKVAATTCLVSVDNAFATRLTF